MNLRTVAFTCAALLVAACGGSSKEQPPPSGPNVSYAGSLDAVSLSSTVDKEALAAGAAGLAQGFSGAAGAASAFAAGAPQRPALVKDALRAAANARHRADLSASVSGAVSTMSGPCDGGGSATISVNDADGDETTTTSGDYVEIAFRACDDGMGTVNYGSFRLTIQTTSGDDFVADATTVTQDVSFGLTLAFNHFATMDANDSWSGINGNMTVSFAASTSAQSFTYMVSGDFIEGASGVGSTVTDAFRLAALQGDTAYRNQGVEIYTGMGTPGATLAETRWQLDARVCSLEMLGCLNVDTNPPFAQHETALYPYTGTLKVYDDAGDFVQVAANDESGSVTLSWSFEAGVYTGNVTTTWACLDDPAACQ